MTRIYPDSFEYGDNLPSGVTLRFDQEATVDDLVAKPTLYITREEFESDPGAHVFAESINLATNNEGFSTNLWCHFKGEIVKEEVEYKDKKSNETKAFETLRVVPDSMASLELILRPKKQGV